MEQPFNEFFVLTGGGEKNALPFISRPATGSEGIYYLLALTLPLLFCAGISLAPIPLVVKCAGTITRYPAPLSLSFPVTGNIQSIQVTSGQSTSKNQLLVTLSNEAAFPHTSFLQQQKDILLQRKEALRKITGFMERNTPFDESSLPEPEKAAWKQYQLLTAEKLLTLSEAGRILTQHQPLYESRIVSPEQWQKLLVEKETAEVRLRQHKSQHLHHWYQEKESVQQKISDINHQLSAVQTKRAQLHLHAPASGTVEWNDLVQAGEPVQAHQVIGKLTAPGARLLQLQFPAHRMHLIKKGIRITWRGMYKNYPHDKIYTARIASVSPPGSPGAEVSFEKNWGVVKAFIGAEENFAPPEGSPVHAFVPVGSISVWSMISEGIQRMSLYVSL